MPPDTTLLDGDPEAEEVEWLKKQFQPTDMVNKGTAIKIQVSVPRALHWNASGKGWPPAQCRIPRPPPERSWPLACAQQARYNRNKADQVRKEREEALRLRQERADKRMSDMAELRRQRGEKDQEALERLRKSNAESAAEMRQQRQMREQQKKRQEEETMAILHARSQAARKLDSILDAREEEQDARERAEGTAARLATAEAKKQQRKKETAWKREKARLAKEQAEEARAARAQELEDKKNQGAGTRQAKIEWKERGDQQEMRRLGRVKSQRDAILNGKNEARQIQQRQLDERKASAKLERENDHIARDAKEGIVQANRVARAKQQAARYVPQLEVEGYIGEI